jgi:preprotein translocase SecE subunit
MAELEPQLAPAAPGKFEVARDFLLDTRVEMDKVSWPSKDELYNSTRAVLISAMVLGMVIGLLDFFLQKILIDFVGSLTR